MRVLFISNGFPPAQVGGTETYTAGLAAELSRRGHSVEVLCGGTWDAGGSYWGGVEEERHGEVVVRRVHVNWKRAPDPFRFLFDNPRVAAYLRRHLEAAPPDVVHVTSCERLSASTIGVAKEAGLPVVLSLTDFWFLCPRMTLLRSDGENCSWPASPRECTACLAADAKVYRWSRAVLPEPAAASLLAAVGRTPSISRLRGLRGMIGDMAGRRTFLREAFGRADRRITASPFVKAQFVASGFDDPIRVQAYGHDLGWVEEHVTKAPSDRLRLGFVGQIARHKGVHVLIEAVKALPADVQSRVDVHIYGDMEKAGAYGIQLRQLAAEMPGVRFRGTYRRNATAEVFSGLDVLVVPSLWFDFPLVVHEAFASSTPVVATRLGGMAETVRHGVDGLLFERGDVAALAHTLQRLVAEPDLLAALRAGIQPVRTMASDACDMEAIYGDLTSRKIESSLCTTLSHE